MTSVSVIATVLNEAQDIEMLVTSVMAQTFPPAELIVLDGGSTDGTWERLLAAKAKYSNLVPIRDDKCNLAFCAGPIGRGRNLAIAAASTPVIACIDAGCSYAPDWLQNLTDPIHNGRAEYALGGSCMAADGTTWDLAAAAFLGVKLDPQARTKSCTARSMAFRKDLWQRIGGFPEDILFGEDTVFDLKARSLVTPAFVTNAKAFYRPGLNFASAVRQLGSYAISDGVAGVRRARLLRNLGRCFLQVFAVLALIRTPIPLACVLLFESHTAFRLDWRDLRGESLKVLGARLFFSSLVPWIVAWNHLRGILTKENRPNRQNTLAPSV